MKIKVKDFFEAYYEDEHTALPSAERVKELTMKKINDANNKTRRFSRAASVAAVLAVVLTFSAVSITAGSFYGLIPTKGWSDAQIQDMIDRMTVDQEDISESCREDGTTYFHDRDGNLIGVMSPEEYLRYEKALMREEEKRNRKAAGQLVDMDTFAVEPNSISVVSTGGDGMFGDFILGNGDVVVLCAEGATPYDLKAGDVVTIEFDASGACSMSIGVVQDRVYQKISFEKAEHHSVSYTVLEDGQYCFTLGYYSSDAENFTNGSIQINE